MSGLLSRLTMDLRVRTAAHPNTPAADLKRLSRSTSDEVRAHVAANANCPPRLMPRLARDLPPVARGLAMNPKCSPKLLAHLCLPQPLWTWSYVMWEAADNPNTPPQALRQLIEHCESEMERVGTEYDSDEDPDDDDDWFLIDHSWVSAARVIKDSAEANLAARDTPPRPHQPDQTPGMRLFGSEWI